MIINALVLIADFILMENNIQILMIRIIAKRKRKQLDNIMVTYIITKDNGYYLAMDIYMKKNSYLNRRKD